MFWRQVVSHSPTSSDELSHARGRGSPYLRHLDELNGLIDRGGSLSGNERNCVFLNLGPKPNKKRFATASTVTGLDQADDTRCYGLTDWDHDGDVDLWAMNRTGPRVRVMLNQQSTVNHFLSLKLVGRTCNTDAIGARVEVIGNATESRPMTKSLRAGEGFLSQSTKWLHFGLGRSDAIHAVTVHWPGGAPERFEGLAVDHQYELVQGAGVPLRLSTKTNGFQVEPPAEDLGRIASSEHAAVFLTSRVPLPRIPLKTADGRTTRLEQVAEFPLLLNFWATWCAPCQQELRDLAMYATQLRQSGVTVVALSVDGLGSERLDDADLSTYITELDLPFFVGLATDETRLRFQLIDDLLFGQKRDLPVPVSFLLDQDGRVAAIYRGPLQLTTLNTHISQLKLTGRSLYEAALPFPGKWYRPRGFSTPLLLPIRLYQRQQLEDAADYLLKYTTTLASQQDFVSLTTQVASRLEPNSRSKAVQLYRNCLNKDPNNVAALNNLAWNLTQQENPSKRDIAEALQLAKRAAQLTGNGVATILDTLAQAQLRAGHKTNSMDTLKRAAQLAKRSGNQQQYDKIHSMIEKLRHSK